MNQMTLSRSLILKLYRDLLKYSEQLKYTDKIYYKQYIRNQFEKNREPFSEYFAQLAYQVIFLVA